ncbi:hypothetical protein Cgig2_023105 [Carnegiea gigantea]|uniref:PB1-like domain-containing protein n=1 Tax=Carnegiea gigantea TaxID=171969 RepID=A0A9Q1GK82_9CARY|nr:hypothetical protein Cgig2_023105 [Carnegiea gigantea]
MDDAACKDAPVEGLDDVTLEINYGGVFKKGESGLEYKGGGSKTLWPVDADSLSYFEVKGLVEDIGFTNIEEIYYVIPWLSMKDGIRPLKNDYDVLDMAECARKTKKISAYIVHKVDEAIVIPPALPSCEAEKETCTSKEPKSLDRKRVKHVAKKRTSLRGKVPTSNATHVTSKEKGPTTTVNNSGSNEKGPSTAGDVSAIVGSKLPKERVPVVSAIVESAKEKVSPVPTKAQQQFANDFEDDRPDSPIPWDVLVEPRLNPEQPQLQPEIQQMPIPSQAQRGRGRPTSRRRGRGLGRGRGRATEKGREGERIRTNDNASTSGATSMIDVETGHFLSQASVGSSCLPQP